MLLLREGGGGVGVSAEADPASWSLVMDANAYMGTHSYIAYTQDIKSPSASASGRGHAGISWTIIAGSGGGILSFAAYGSVYAPHDALEFSVDGVPEVVLTVPSLDWEQRYVEIEPGKHTVRWRLIKNLPGLSADVIDDVGLPEGYQGYAKIDAIMFVNNQVSIGTTKATELPSITATSTATTSEETEAAATEVATTTEAPPAATEPPPPTTPPATTVPPPATIVTSEATEAATTEVATTTEAPAATEPPPPPVEGTVTSTDATFTVETIPTAEVAAANGTFAIESPHNEDAMSEATTSDSEPPHMEEAMAEVTTSGPTIPIQELGSVSCPPGLQSVDGLPNCCVEDPSYLGDGACDPRESYNTEACAFDLGDCCYESCNRETAYGCVTEEGDIDDVGPFGFFCLDPRYSIIDETLCQVENREWLGDGGCDAEGGYNTEECENIV